MSFEIDLILRCDSEVDCDIEECADNCAGSVSLDGYIDKEDITRAKRDLIKKAEHLGWLFVKSKSYCASCAIIRFCPKCGSKWDCIDQDPGNDNGTYFFICSKCKHQESMRDNRDREEAAAEKYKQGRYKFR